MRYSGILMGFQWDILGFWWDLNGGFQCCLWTALFRTWLFSPLIYVFMVIYLDIASGKRLHNYGKSPCIVNFPMKHVIIIIFLK
jgi:hypothetical protein